MLLYRNLKSIFHKLAIWAHSASAALAGRPSAPAMECFQHIYLNIWICSSKAQEGFRVVSLSTSMLGTPDIGLSCSRCRHGFVWTTLSQHGSRFRQRLTPDFENEHLEICTKLLQTCGSLIGQLCTLPGYLLRTSSLPVTITCWGLLITSFIWLKFSQSARV